jgi:hypothetical protein
MDSSHGGLPNKPAGNPGQPCLARGELANSPLSPSQVVAWQRPALTARVRQRSDTAWRTRPLAGHGTRATPSWAMLSHGDFACPLYPVHHQQTVHSARRSRSVAGCHSRVWRWCPAGWGGGKRGPGVPACSCGQVAGTLRGVPDKRARAYRGTPHDAAKRGPVVGRLAARSREGPRQPRGEPDRRRNRKGALRNALRPTPGAAKVRCGAAGSPGWPPSG